MGARNQHAAVAEADGLASLEKKQEKEQNMVVVENPSASIIYNGPTMKDAQQSLNGAPVILPCFTYLGECTGRAEDTTEYQYPWTRTPNARMYREISDG